MLCWESLQNRLLSYRPGLALGFTGKGAGSRSTPCCTCSCAKQKALTGLQKFKVLGMDSLISATTSEDNLSCVEIQYFSFFVQLYCHWFVNEVIDV